FAGGVSGGISNGNEIVVRVAVRPATSIGKPQVMAKQQGGTETVAIEGRHDPCICPRVVPVGEAMLALALVDAWLHQRALRARDRRRPGPPPGRRRRNRVLRSRVPVAGIR